MNRQNSIARLGRIFHPPQQHHPYLHHATVEVFVDQSRQCCAFYQEILGLHPERSQHPRSVWFQEGVHLYWGNRFQMHEPSDEPAAHHIALVLGDRYEQVVATCKRWNLFVAYGEAYWGSPRAYIKDPANNRLEVMEYPPS